MSTDLEFLPSIINYTLETPTTATTTKAKAAVVVEVSTEPSEHIPDRPLKREQPTKEIIHDTKNNDKPTSAASEGVKREGEEEEEDPITPTSDEFKIPAPKSPPPAPRKRRCGAAVACRKKLDFIDHMNHPQLIIPKEEVIQEFFASSFDQIHSSRTLLKRRCPCI